MADPPPTSYVDAQSVLPNSPPAVAALRGQAGGRHRNCGRVVKRPKTPWRNEPLRRATVNQQSRRTLQERHDAL